MRRKRNKTSKLQGGADQSIGQYETEHHAEAEDHAVHQIGVHGAVPNAELPTDERPAEVDGVDRGSIRVRDIQDLSDYESCIAME